MEKLCPKNFDSMSTTAVKEPETKVPLEEIALVLRRLDDVQKHIRNVKDAANTLGRKLIERGEVDFGVTLIAESELHDNSKYRGIEFEFLHRNEDGESLKTAIRQHQLTNRHHPEYWSDINTMPRLYIAELACDLCARSRECLTDLREYVREKFLPRYGLTTSSKVYRTLKEFIDMLSDDPFKPIK